MCGIYQLRLIIGFIEICCTKLPWYVIITVDHLHEIRTIQQHAKLKSSTIYVLSNCHQFSFGKIPSLLFSVGHWTVSNEFILLLNLFLDLLIKSSWYSFFPPCISRYYVPKLSTTTPRKNSMHVRPHPLLSLWTYPFQHIYLVPWFNCSLPHYAFCIDGWFWIQPVASM